MTAAHNRIIFAGTCNQNTGNSADIFEFTMADASTLTLQQLATKADTVMRNYWANAQYATGCSEFANYTNCRAEAINAEGKVTDSYYLQSYNAIPGLNQAQNCTILSHAVTLETGQLNARGRKVRGRFFPPANAGTEGSSCGIDDATTYAQAWGSVVQALNDAGCVISVASSTSAGLVSVTGVSVDTVIDTMRSRKNRVVGQRTPIHAINAG